LKASKVDFNGAKLVFATSCDLNYLAQAAVLAESVKNFYPTSKFILGLNEVDPSLEREILSRISVFDYVKVGKKLHPKFLELSSRYGIIELCCAVKPYLIKLAFEKKAHTVVYLDPDALLFESLDTLEKAFKEGYEAALTPHVKNLGNMEMEVSSMAHGIFNFGFLALRNTPDSLRFLEWWNLRLEKHCIRDHRRGIFTDQSWGGLLVGNLNAKIIRDVGYNFATWNLSDHQFTRKKAKYLVDGEPLVFAHFSGYQSESIYKVIKKFKIKNTQVYDLMYDDYDNSVKTYENILHEVLKKRTNKVHFKEHFDLGEFYKRVREKFMHFLYKRAPRLLRCLMFTKSLIRPR
jgi:hypothetical protein